MHSKKGGRAGTLTLGLGLAIWVGGVGLLLSPVAEAASKVAQPSKKAKAKAPPKGAQLAGNRRFDKSLKWKTDAKSHSVFALDANKQLWFLDPTSGWPYTINEGGTIYTADPWTGAVYSMGKRSSWVGDALYFFTLWDVVDGRYRVPSYNTYVTWYSDSSLVAYNYDSAYDEVWEYDDYFSSDEFDELADDLEDAADGAEAAADDAEDAADEAEVAADDAEDAADEAQVAADDAEDDADEAEEEVEDDAEESDDGGDDD